MPIFVNREDAGKQLALRLVGYQDALVLGMARGGVAVAAPIARRLQFPLRPLVVRKIGAPGNRELAIGAVSETGDRWLDPVMIKVAGANSRYLDEEIARQQDEARRQQRAYSSVTGLGEVRGRTAIVVDDGVATGASALVALRTVRELGASRVVLAVPVASHPALAVLRSSADDLVILAQPDPFVAVGLYYSDFEQVDDAEVKALLCASQQPPSSVGE